MENISVNCSMSVGDNVVSLESGDIFGTEKVLGCCVGGEWVTQLYKNES